MTHNIDTADGMDAAVDELLRVLSDARRRFVLQCFATDSEPMALDDLASRIARWEENGHEATDDATTAVRTSLHHVHLPVLAEYDLVEYDPEGHVVAASYWSKSVENSLSDTHRFIEMLQSGDEATLT